MKPEAIETKTLVDAVAEKLRSRILSGYYSPGFAIAERRIAEEFGIHRPPVHSAIVRLVHEGLLRRERGKRAYIPSLTVEDIEDIFAVRMLIEGEAVYQIAEKGLSLNSAAQQLQLMEELDDDDDWESILRLDFQFHKALVDAISSPRLSAIYQVTSTESRLALTYLNVDLLSPTKLAQEHRELFDQMVSGDTKEAVEAYREHLIESAEFIIRQINHAAE